MRSNVVARTRRFASTAAAALAILAAAPTALGQDGAPRGSDQAGQDGARRGGGDAGGRQRGGGMRGMRGMGSGMADLREQLEPDFIRRDVPIFIQQLQLDAGQSLVLETLMSDYEETYQTASTAVQAEISDMGRQMFANMVTPEMRERMMTVGQEIQEDLRRLAEERGGQLSEEERRAFFRERMQAIQQQMTQDAQMQGANQEMRRMMGEMFNRFEDWRVRKETMRRDLVDGLKATLSDDQMAAWAAFERFLTREKTLPKSRLAGEGTNLILVLDELGLPEASFGKIEPMLDDYELRLDEALRARNDYLFQSTGRLFKALEQGNPDEANKILERQVQYRTAVREVNEQYRAAFVSALGDTPEAKELERAILADGYERVYRPTATQRAFEAALAMSGLDPSVQESIASLSQAFDVELAGVNRRVFEVLRREEPARSTRESQRFVNMVSAAMSGDFAAMGPGGFGPFGGGQDGPDPVRDAFDQRQRLEDSYLDRLKALLTPEQFEQLPRGGRGGRGGQGGQGGGAGMGGGIARMLDRLPAEQRDAIMKAVDTNGNGEIDENERGELFRQLRELGVGGMGGQGGDGARRGGGNAGRGGNS